MKKLNFDLPGISPVGLELIALLNSPDTTVKQIAAQAKLDPVIYGNLVACANSPMYKGVQSSLDILTSLVRLGQREIKRIVYQVVLRGAFFHESSALNAILQRIWMQSLTANIFMQKLVAAIPEAYALEHEEVELLGSTTSGTSCCWSISRIASWIFLHPTPICPCRNFSRRSGSGSMITTISPPDERSSGTGIFPSSPGKSSASTNAPARFSRAAIRSCTACCVWPGT